MLQLLTRLRQAFLWLFVVWPDLTKDLAKILGAPRFPSCWTELLHVAIEFEF